MKSLSSFLSRALSLIMQEALFDVYPLPTAFTLKILHVSLIIHLTLAFSNAVSNTLTLLMENVELFTFFLISKNPPAALQLITYSFPFSVAVFDTTPHKVVSTIISASLRESSSATMAIFLMILVPPVNCADHLASSFGSYNVSL